LKTEINGRGDPLRWPRDTLYPQKLALTSLTSGGRSVGIVRLRTTSDGVCLFFVDVILFLVFYRDNKLICVITCLNYFECNVEDNCRIQIWALLVDGKHQHHLCITSFQTLYRLQLSTRDFIFVKHKGIFIVVNSLTNISSRKYSLY
jgi:hypothetical protein